MIWLRVRDGMVQGPCAGELLGHFLVSTFHWDRYLHFLHFVVKGLRPRWLNASEVIVSKPDVTDNSFLMKEMLTPQSRVA